jgi:hypothetical protein
MVKYKALVLLPFHPLYSISRTSSSNQMDQDQRELKQLHPPKTYLYNAEHD